MKIPEFNSAHFSETGYIFTVEEHDFMLNFVWERIYVRWEQS